MVYVLTGSTDDLEAAFKVQEFAESLGITLSIDEPKEIKLAPRIRTVDKPHFIYAIYRGTTLGYVGVSVNPERRLQQHMNRISMAQEAFTVWLVAGKQSDDLRYVVSDPISYTEANNKEALLIRRYSPQFNKTHNKGAYLSLDKGVDLLALASE